MSFLDLLGAGGSNGAAPNANPVGGFLSRLGLDDPDKRSRLGQSLIALGGSMMKAGGPSYTPQNFLGAAGEGLQSFAKTYQGTADDAFRRAYTRAQIEHMGLSTQLQRQQLANAAKQQAAEQAYISATGGVGTPGAQQQAPAPVEAPAAPVAPGAAPQQPPARSPFVDAPVTPPGPSAATAPRSPFVDAATPGPAPAPAPAPASPQAGSDVTARMQAEINEQERLAMMAAQAGNGAMAAQHKNNAQSIRDNAIKSGVFMDNKTGQQYEVPGFRERELRKETDSGLVKDGYKPLGPDGRTEYIPGGPKDPSRPKDLTEGDKTAIREADNAVLAGQNSISSIRQLQALNDKAYSGAFANLGATIARNDPFGLLDKDRGAATTMYNTETLNGVLANLKSTFGGSPTEGERKVMEEVQASVDKSPAERKIILERALDVAQAKHSFNTQQQKGIRGGNYYGSDNAPNIPEVQPRVPGQSNAASTGNGVSAEQASSAPQITNDADYAKLSPGVLYRDSDGKFRRKR